MNPGEDVEAVADEEIETEEKEKTVCARLVLSNEQINDRNHVDIQSRLSAMDDITFSSIAKSQTPEVSSREVDDVEKPPEFNEIFAKFVFTDEQESDLREAFNLLDYSGEGKINAEDFRVAIKALGYEPTKEELQRMISAVDKGDSGKLSFENFETAIMRKIMSQDSDGDIMKSFRLFDMDDAGFINFDNIKQVTEILGHYLTDEEIDEMMDDADRDFDGLISVQEFMKMIKNCVHIVTP